MMLLNFFQKAHGFLRLGRGKERFIVEEKGSSSLSSDINRILRGHSNLRETDDLLKLFVFLCLTGKKFLEETGV